MTIHGVGTGRIYMVITTIQNKTTIKIKITTITGKVGKMIIGDTMETTKIKMAEKVLGGVSGIKRLNKMQIMMSGGVKMGGIPLMKEMMKEKMKEMMKEKMKEMLKERTKEMMNTRDLM